MQQQVFGEWAMALLSPPPRGDHHAHRGRRHASHHDDNGPSPPPPHSKLSFLLFDFTFGQEFRSAASADSHAAAQEEQAATRKGVWGWGGWCHHGDLQIPLWQLPRPQSLSCNMETVGRGKVWAGWVWLVQDGVIGFLH